MRERHNIVGTEVGRPPPPFYQRPGLKLRTRRSVDAKVWVFGALMLTAVGAALAMGV